MYIDSRYTDVACFERVGIGCPLTTYGAAKVITSLRAGTNLSLALDDTLRIVQLSNRNGLLNFAFQESLLK